MKKTTALFIFGKTALIAAGVLLGLQQNLQAQTTLTATNLPVAGDQFFNKTIGDTSLSPGSGGANVTWNYASYFISPLTLNEEFVVPAATPYAASFPQANLAVNSYFSPSGYEYYKNNGTELLYYGFKDNNDELIINNTQKVLTVPLSYGGSVMNVPVTGTGLFGANLSGTISVTADGWGTLILNDGTYTNTTRVVYDFDLQTDFGGPGTETYYRIKRYTWYHSSRRAPVFQVSIREISGSTTAPRQKYITRTTITTGVEESGSQAAFRLIQNPVVSSVNILINRTGNWTIRICDMKGAIVRQQTVDCKSGETIQLNTEDLSSGTYMISAGNAEISWQEQFLKF